MFSVLINLPFYILFILSVKLYFLNYSGDRRAQILPTRAACWPGQPYQIASRLSLVLLNTGACRIVLWHMMHFVTVWSYVATCLNSLFPDTLRLCFSGPCFKQRRHTAKTCSTGCSSSSSFYCPSVANAPNVLQPYWLIVLPLDVPDLTASLLL